MIHLVAPFILNGKAPAGNRQALCWMVSGLHGDEGGELGDQHQTDDGDTRASHELLHTLAFGTG